MNNNNNNQINFKQIEFNENSGKFFLIDYNNTKIECNLFGSPIPTHSKFSKKNFSSEKKNQLKTNSMVIFHFQIQFHFHS